MAAAVNAPPELPDHCSALCLATSPYPCSDQYSTKSGNAWTDTMPLHGTSRCVTLHQACACMLQVEAAQGWQRLGSRSLQHFVFVGEKTCCAYGRLVPTSDHFQLPPILSRQTWRWLLLSGAVICPSALLSLLEPCAAASSSRSRAALPTDDAARADMLTHYMQPKSIDSEEIPVWI